MFPSKGGSNPNINKWIDRRSTVYTYTRILFNLKKERNSKTCYNVDETWVHHDKWNKTQNDLCCMTPLIQDVYSSQTQREQNSSGQDPMDYRPARVLGPWDLPGKNIGVGCHFFLQRIFQTQGLNSHLLHCRQIRAGAILSSFGCSGFSSHPGPASTAMVYWVLVLTISPQLK